MLHSFSTLTVILLRWLDVAMEYCCVLEWDALQFGR